jgi:hypothetical protein
MYSGHKHTKLFAIPMTHIPSFLQGFASQGLITVALAK